MRSVSARASRSPAPLSEALRPRFGLSGVRGVSVIIPVRNAAAIIRPLLLQTRQVMERLGLPFETIVVDDHSTDGTPRVARAAIAEESLPASALENRAESGRGAALVAGIDAARYPLLLMVNGEVDALAVAPEALAQLATDDVVVGWLDEGAGPALSERLKGAADSLAMRLLLGVAASGRVGIIACWKHVYDSAPQDANGRFEDWEFVMRFLASAQAAGFKIGALPSPIARRPLSGAVDAHDSAPSPLDVVSSAARLRRDLRRAALADATVKSPVAHAAAPGMAREASRPVDRREALRKAAIEWGVTVVALIALVWAITGASFLSTTRYYGIPGDTGQYMWYMGWPWYALTHGRQLLVTNAFNYPTPVYLMDQTSVVGLGFIAGWLYPLVGVIFTYNLLIVVNYLLVMVFGKLTLREWGVGPVMSSVGGLLFCLTPFITTQQIAHLNLFFVSPLFVVGYIITRLALRAGRPGWVAGAALGLTLTFEVYISIEQAMTTVVFLAVLYGMALIVAFKATRAWTRRMLAPRFLIALCATLLLDIVAVVNYEQGAHLPGSPMANLADVWAWAYGYSNDLITLVTPSPFYLIHSQRLAALTANVVSDATEWNLYLTLPFMALIAVFAARQWRQARMRTVTLTAALMALCSLGPRVWLMGVESRIPGPWRLAMDIPLLRQALPARLGLYAFYLTIILVVVGIDRLMRGALASDAGPRGFTASRAGLGVALAGLALVAALWLPAMPAMTATMPRSAAILRADRVVDTYIGQRPTLVLFTRRPSISGVPQDFNLAQGALADAGVYDLVATDMYGQTFTQTPAYAISLALSQDSDGLRTVAAMRTYWPSLGAQRVLFISTDDQPMTSGQVAEISAYLGHPLYNNQGLVIVWGATPVTQSTAATGSATPLALATR